VVTLPAELRETYNIQEGDTLRLIDVDGVFVLTRMVSLVPELAQEIERLRLEAGLTTEELLVELREQRARRQLGHSADGRDHAHRCRNVSPGDH
jgi:bifunctional DNA-binding transcriptional regulator/antitoxin component of YhaV-PrlF toxin-antitoxin module